VNATVPYVPEGTTTTTVSGTQYYVYGDTYYIGKSQDGDTVYQVVEKTVVG